MHGLVLPGNHVLFKSQRNYYALTSPRNRGSFEVPWGYLSQSSVSKARESDGDSRILAPLGPLFPIYIRLAIQIYR